MFFIRMYMLYSQKLLDMDYEDVEDARVQAKLDKIKQLQNWNGQGLMRLYWVAGSLSKGVVGTAGKGLLQCWPPIGARRLSWAYRHCLLW